MILNYEDTITPLLVIKFIDFKPLKYSQLYSDLLPF